jgi:hypothetical protein
MGRCQGFFCGAELAAHLDRSREGAPPGGEAAAADSGGAAL